MALERSELLAAPVPGPVEGVLGDVLRRAAERAGRPAARARRRTRGDLDGGAAARRRERGRRGPAGRSGPGARIATCLGNGPAPVLLQLGVALAGMTLVPVNPRSRPAELEHALGLSGAVGVFAAEDVGGNPVADLAAQAAGRLPRCRRSAGAGGWRCAIDRGRPPRSRRRPGAPRRRSSSPRARPGRAKGVLHHARGHGRSPGGRSPTGSGPTAGRRLVNPMPLFHTAGNVLGVVGAPGRGAEHVVLAVHPGAACSRRWPTPRRDPALGRADAAGPARAPRTSPAADPSGCEVLFTGGMTVTPSFVDRVEAVFGARLRSPSA